MLCLVPKRDDRQRHVSEGELKHELLSDLGAMIAREVELDELLTTFGLRVAQAMRADRATLWLLDAATGELRSRVANLPELDEELRVPIGHGVAGYAAQNNIVVNVRDAASDQRWAPEIDQRTGYQTKSMLCAPIADIHSGTLRGVVQVLNKQHGSFTRGDESFLSALAGQIARALDYTSLRADDTSLGVPVRGRFNHIIGESPAMQAVYDKIVRAAATDATVLMHGETGTGKGLMARAIHVNSKRRAGPLVHVDCTTLPASLVESELFGHERGAYTGADSRVQGKVELASGGTLFLDEIGEMPLELQGKLLRLVQERRFERVGGRQTIEADVRIVVATNRDLAAMVKSGGFRSDLYYRVRVIDIELPPLRSRGGRDVISLAEHFAGVYSRRYEKRALRLSADAHQALVRHTWPGNVRELEHAIERAVVLCEHGVIDADALGLLPAERITDIVPGAIRPAGDSNLDAASNLAGASDLAGPGALAGSQAGEGVRVPHGLSLEEASRAYAAAAVERAGGNRSAAARELGIGRNKLARLLRSPDPEPDAQ
jgi:Nif-specific regulatory protein